MWTKRIIIAVLTVVSGVLTGTANYILEKLLDWLGLPKSLDFASLMSLPWKHIIGFPILIAGLAWLAWDVIGRAAFRARFGADRVLREHLRPLEEKFCAINRQITSLHSALEAIENRRLLSDTAQKLEDLQGHIFHLLNSPREFNDGSGFLLVEFIKDWFAEFEYGWAPYAALYDEEQAKALTNIEPAPLAGNEEEVARVGSYASPYYLRFLSAHEQWKSNRDELMYRVDEVASGRRLLVEDAG